MQYAKIADHCGGCSRFQPTSIDEEVNETLGRCEHNPRPGSIRETSKKCLAYTPVPEVAGLRGGAPAQSSAPTSGGADAVQVGMMKDTLRNVVREVLFELLGPDDVQIAERWSGGTMRLDPGRSGVLGKDVPIEAFFNKIIMVRDRLRVLEAKINAHPKLEAEDKIELQGYITKCYGSLTTFNVLFAEERDRFVGERKGR